MNNEYALNFIIPTGPSGDNGVIEPSISLVYNDMTTSGTVSINRSTIYPKDSTVFTVQNNQLLFNSRGKFEYNISGIIKKQNSDSTTNLVLRTRNNSGITNNLFVFNVNQGEDEIYFFQTKIGEYSGSQSVNLIFNKNADSSSKLENVELTIKKLYDWE